MKEAERVNYSIKFKYAYPIHGVQDKKEPLGNKEGRYCIFCGETEGETTFSKEAHIIPAALGNKHFTNWNECDVCNEHIFSKYEDDLVNFLALDRILFRGRKRRGTGKPKLKPLKGNSYITSEPGTNNVSISLDPSEIPFIKFEGLDNGPGTATMTYTDLPMYSYVSICKTLVHMGWSVLEQYWDKLNQNFSYVYTWLKGQLDVYPLYLNIANISGGLAHIIFEVYESQEGTSKYPFIFRLYYGSKIITFYLPASNEVNDEPNVVLPYPEILEKRINDVTAYTVLEDERIAPPPVSRTFNYSGTEIYE